jgi:hypothetical protein
MYCRQARTLFSGRLDMELDDKQARELQQHLEVCTDCSARWVSFEMTVRLVRSLPQVEPDASFVGQVFDRVRGYEAGQRVLYPVGARRNPIGALVGLWRGLGRSPFLLPARLAGAMAFGLLLGFAVSERADLPGMILAHSSIAPPAVEGMASTGGGAAAVNGATRPGTHATARPFADLAEELAKNHGEALAANDSMAGSPKAPIMTMPGVQPGYPGNPGQQVLWKGSDGRAQITF